MDEDFKEELRQLLNSHSIDNVVETPDYILVDLVCEFLTSIGKMHETRDRHIGRIY